MSATWQRRRAGALGGLAEASRRAPDGLAEVPRTQRGGQRRRCPDPRGGLESAAAAKGVSEQAEKRAARVPSCLGWVR
jgi:hypothetical protein